MDHWINCLIKTPSRNGKHTHIHAYSQTQNKIYRNKYWELQSTVLNALQFTNESLFFSSDLWFQINCVFLQYVLDSAHSKNHPTQPKYRTNKRQIFMEYDRRKKNVITHSIAEHEQTLQSLNPFGMLYVVRICDNTIFEKIGLYLCLYVLNCSDPLWMVRCFTPIARLFMICLLLAVFDFFLWDLSHRNLRLQW